MVTTMSKLCIAGTTTSGRTNLHTLAKLFIGLPLLPTKWHNFRIPFLSFMWPPPTHLPWTHHLPLRRLARFPTTTILIILYLLFGVGRNQVPGRRVPPCRESPVGRFDFEDLALFPYPSFCHRPPHTTEATSHDQNPVYVYLFSNRVLDTLSLLDNLLARRWSRGSVDIDSRGVCVFILFRGEGRWSDGKYVWCNLGTRPVMRLLVFCFCALGLLGVYVSSKLLV